MANAATGLWTQERALAGEAAEPRLSQPAAQTISLPGLDRDHYARQNARFKALAQALTTQLAGLYLGE
ncbi:MAG: hypothetical protein ACHQ4H_19200, partial [Ktedonobacterales bacterium]